MGAFVFIPANTKRGGDGMAAKRSDRMLGELFAVIADYLTAPEDDTDLRGRVMAWLDVAEGRVCESDSAGRLAGGPEPIDRARVLVALLRAQGYVTTTELARRAAICPETARLFLRRLQVRKVVRKVGDKKGARWIASLMFAEYADNTSKRFSDTSSSDKRDGAEMPSLALPVDTLAISEVVA